MQLFRAFSPKRRANMTMSNGIMGNGGFFGVKCFSVIEENSADTSTHAFFSSLLKHCEPQSLYAKLLS